MLNIRTQSFALTAKFAALAKLKEVTNIVYFHGFTMHDHNYPLVATMLNAGLITYIPSSVEEQSAAKHGNLVSDLTLEQRQAYLQAIFNSTSLSQADANLQRSWLTDLFPEESTKQEAAQGLSITTITHSTLDSNTNFTPLFNTNSKNIQVEQAPYGKLITVSLDYSGYPCTIEQAKIKLQDLLQNQPSVWYSYSYGNLLAQLYLESYKLNYPTTFVQIKAVHALHGVPLPYDDKLAIPSALALHNASNWSSDSLAVFGFSMGMPRKQIELIKQRASQVNPLVISAQRDTLRDLCTMLEHFLALSQEPTIMSKWTSITAAKQDKIYILPNITRFAQKFAIPYQEVDSPHYLVPSSLIDQLCNPANYATI